MSIKPRLSDFFWFAAGATWSLLVVLHFNGLREAREQVRAHAELEILKLSRENTKVRSLSISLNQKRKATLLCQAALTDVEQALAEAAGAGFAYNPPSPR